MSNGKWDTEKSVKAIRYGILVEKTLTTTQIGNPRITINIVSHRDQSVSVSFRDILPVEYSEDSISFDGMLSDSWSRVDPQEFQFEGEIQPEEDLTTTYTIDEPGDISQNQLLITPKIDSIDQISGEVVDLKNDDDSPDRQGSTDSLNGFDNGSDSHIWTTWAFEKLSGIVDLAFGSKYGSTGNVSGDEIESSNAAGQTDDSPSDDSVSWDPPLLMEIYSDPEVAFLELTNETNGSLTEQRLTEQLINEVKNSAAREERIEEFRTILANGTDDLDDGLAQLESQVSELEDRINALKEKRPN